MYWIAAAGAAFTVAQFLFAGMRNGLSWDEVVYVSQLSRHAPAAFFDPARSRGVELIAAPVTAMTSSVVVLRAYLAVLSGLGLFAALAVWRRFRPSWQLALGGILYGGLWVAQYYGPQAMPDEWLAFAVVAAVGLFLRAMPDPGTPRSSLDRPDFELSGPRADRLVTLRWLAACVAIAVLIRPGDAVFLTVALAASVPAIRIWRQSAVALPVLEYLSKGLALGAAEWVLEAFARFGGPLQRLHLASAEQSGFGIHAGAWAELKALNGPTLCRPCNIGWSDPALSLWWLALPVLVTIGILTARQVGHQTSSMLAAWCGLALAAQYLLLIDYAAPRFLLPTYLLLAIPVTDGLVGLARQARTGWLRTTLTATLTAAVALQLVSQQSVLASLVNGTIAYHSEYAKAAADLNSLGIRPPCLINGSIAAQWIPIGFYAGCATQPNTLNSFPPEVVRARGAHPAFAVLLYQGERPPPYATHWRRITLPSTGGLTISAYLQPR